MDNYLNEFKNPSSKFRGAPFWSWNCKLDKEMLLKQIDYLKDMGMGGFTMHCRTGLDTEYLSDEFKEMILACIEKAEELDMKACLYDEDRWPSGAAGGIVTKDVKNRSRYLVFTPYKNDNDHRSSKGFITGGEITNSFGDGEFLGAYEVQIEDGYLAGYKRLENEAEGNNIWYAYLEIAKPSPWYNNQTYLNTLDEEAVKCFIESTYEWYYQTAGEHFGNTVPSIFTDEPQFVRKRVLGRCDEKQEVIIPYTDDFEDSYQALYGESFLDSLPELFWELSNGNISVPRYRYHAHLSKRFAEAFSDQIGRWCKEHGIKLTGHMMEEPTLHSQTAALGEAMLNYKEFEIPGIDILIDSREYTTAKQAQSAARQFGRSQITSELYGVTGWDFDFRGHKLQGDWQAALGVTERVHHLSWVSMAGEAKRDYPASIFYQSPWYKEYPLIEDYFARVGTVIQSGKPHVKIGVIHPVESYWLYFGADEKTGAIRDEMERMFEETAERLLFGLLDFDYISEGLLAELPEEQADKSFICGEMKYDAIVLSGCKTLRRTTLKRLQKFKEAGGLIIFIGDAPAYVEAVADCAPSELADSCCCISEDPEQLMNALDPLRFLDIYDTVGRRSNEYIHQIRETEDGYLIFIANGRAPKTQDIPMKKEYEIRLNCSCHVHLLDALTGETIGVDATLDNGITKFNYTMYQHDSLILVLQKEDSKDAAQSVKPAYELVPVDVLNDVSSYSLEEENVLVLDQARYTFDSQTSDKPEEILRIDNILRSKLHYPQRMEAQAQPWTIEKEDHAAGNLTLTFEILSDIELPEVSLALENYDEQEISWNGDKVQNVSIGYFVDEYIQKVALGGLKKGINILTLTRGFHQRVNLENCFLLGDFGVQVFGNKTRIVKRTETIGFSDLVMQQFPFYTGNLIYECDVNAESGDYVLEVTKFRSTLLKVFVDGGEAGPIAFAPYQVDLGHLNGKHKIQIKAFGNRNNAFGTIHNSSDMKIWSSPDRWRSKGAEYSYEYQLKPTGVLAAPRLFKVTGNMADSVNSEA